MNLFDNGNARLGPLEVELVVGGYGLGAGGRVGVGGVEVRAGADAIAHYFAACGITNTNQ